MSSFICILAGRAARRLPAFTCIGGGCFAILGFGTVLVIVLGAPERNHCRNGRDQSGVERLRSDKLRKRGAVCSEARANRLRAEEDGKQVSNCGGGLGTTPWTAPLPVGKVLEGLGNECSKVLMPDLMPGESI